MVSRCGCSGVARHVDAHFDLPGVDPSSIDVNVERNVLTVKAERTPTYGDDAPLSNPAHAGLSGGRTEPARNYV